MLNRIRMLPSVTALLLISVTAIPLPLALTHASLSSHAQNMVPLVDLTRAVVAVPANLTKPENKAVQMLIEEVEKRTQIRLPLKTSYVADDMTTPIITVGPAAALKSFVGNNVFERLANGRAGAQGAEGYRIQVTEQGATSPRVFVVGNDARGVLFGVGHLLRHLQMTRGKLALPSNFNVQTAPRIPVRGHQLGYRPKTNSYDGWTVAMWEQYIRDLAVFGTNAIELIPPRSDDAPDSPHF
ncbi:MAG: hypothetical protein H0T92_00750, partial [Pyrinomonadaceae bacterium]|nr:hypothetical protein [Pyrinomonadaceae bacterium]